jgi:hypothetical protein
MTQEKNIETENIVQEILVTKSGYLRIPKAVKDKAKEKFGTSQNFPNPTWNATTEDDQIKVTYIFVMKRK